MTTDPMRSAEDRVKDAAWSRDVLPAAWVGVLEACEKAERHKRDCPLVTPGRSWACTCARDRRVVERWARAIIAALDYTKRHLAPKISPDVHLELDGGAVEAAMRVAEAPSDAPGT